MSEKYKANEHHYPICASARLTSLATLSGLTLNCSSTPEMSYINKITTQHNQQHDDQQQDRPTAQQHDHMDNYTTTKPHFNNSAQLQIHSAYLVINRTSSPHKPISNFAREGRVCPLLSILNRHHISVS